MFLTPPILKPMHCSSAIDYTENCEDTKVQKILNFEQQHEENFQNLHRKFNNAFDISSPPIKS